jgi:hypothetical protein
MDLYLQNITLSLSFNGTKLTFTATIFRSFVWQRDFIASFAMQFNRPIWLRDTENFVSDRALSGFFWISESLVY